jgi:hypothetical protein
VYGRVPASARPRRGREERTPMNQRAIIYAVGAVIVIVLVIVFATN